MDVKDMSKKQLIQVLEQTGHPAQTRTKLRLHSRESLVKLVHAELTASEGAKARFARTVDAMTSAQLMDSLVESTNAGQHRKVQMIRDEIVARMAM